MQKKKLKESGRNKDNKKLTSISISSSFRFHLLFLFTQIQQKLKTQKKFVIQISSREKKKKHPSSLLLHEIAGKFEMSATIISEPMMVSSSQDPSSTSSSTCSQIEIQFAKCDCCGLTEECTPQYIERIRERYMGKWVCGLCSEAVKDEVIRSQRLITTEEALNRHLNICRKFRSTSAGDGAAELITAFRHILRRSLDSPRGLRSTPASPTRDSDRKKRPVLTRSESCFPEL